MKANHRRITGLRNWNSYIVRNGEMIVLVDDALRQQHVIARLRTVGYEKYATRKADGTSGYPKASSVGDLIVSPSLF